VLDAGGTGGVDRCAVLLVAVREIGRADQKHAFTARERGAQSRRLVEIGEADLGASRGEIGERLRAAGDENQSPRPAGRKCNLGRAPA